MDGVAENANNYTLPKATDNMLGGVKTGYTANGKNYPVLVDSAGNMYVAVPWTDTNTVYNHPTTSGNKHIPSGGAAGKILRWGADGTAVWGDDKDTVYTHPTTAGHKHIPAGGELGQVLECNMAGTGEASWVNYGQAMLCGVANNLTTNLNNFVLDAKLGPVIDKRLVSLETDLGKLNSALENMILIRTGLSNIKINMTNNISTNYKFCYLITCNGRTRQEYATYIVQGYGAGTDRTHVKTLQAGSSFSFQVLEDETAIIINGGTNWDLTIFILYGSIPNITNA